MFGIGPRKRLVWLTPADRERAIAWTAAGFTEAMRTPDQTLVFVTPESQRTIIEDQVACMGCLTHCRFSNWAQVEPDWSTGKKADPRSFCIQKTLQDIAHDGSLEDNLMFAGTTPTASPRPVLLERLRADGEAAGRADHDGALNPA
jgi:hypothetical protein